MWQEYVYLPPGVDGQLNWIGGFIQLDASVEEHEALRKVAREAAGPRLEAVALGDVADGYTITVSTERGRPLAAYWHEVIHYTQTITMSYLYKWTYALLTSVLYAVSAARGQDIGQLLSSERLMIDPGKLPSANRATSEALLAHLGKLDVRGSSGLSPRMLVESHAFITQWRMNRVIIEKSGDVLSTREILDLFCPADTYRVAFDFVRYCFGEEPAELIFIPAAALSLATDDPVATFERIVLTVAGDGGMHAAVDSADPKQVYARLCQVAAVEHYETAPQTYLANPDLFHPIYSDRAKRLLEHPELVDRFFWEPENCIRQVLDVATEPPILGSPTADGVPFLFIPEGMQDDAGRALLDATIGFAATASAAIGSAYDYEATSPRQTKSLHWLTRPSHSPRWISVDEESLASGDVSGVRNLLKPQEGRLIEVEVCDPQDDRPTSVVAPAGGNEDSPTFTWFELIWGRLWFRPGQEDELHKRLWVVFIKRLVAELPKVLAYLDLASPWIEEVLRLSVAPEREGDSTDVILEIAARVVAVGEHGTEVGVEPWIQAWLLTAWLPDEVRALLLQHPTLSQARLS